MKQAIAILFPHSSRRALQALRWQIARRERSQFHWERKFYHWLMGMFCFCLYAFFLTRVQALWTLAVVGTVWVGFDIIRLKFPRLNEMALSVFGRLMRREELRSVSGNSYYILGLFALVLFFPKPVALLSVLCLAVGDPAAAVFGSLYGRHKLVGKKSVEGAVANFVLSALFIFAVGGMYFHLGGAEVLLLAAVGGLISVIAEIMPLSIDDNFSIPMISAVLFSLFLSLVPIL